jgi:hypothetical protein
MSYLEPCIGTLERAREFERPLVSLDAGDLQAVLPPLGPLAVPTLIVWGGGDAFFDVSWACWLRDTIAGGDRRWRQAALPGRASDGSPSAPGTALGHGRAGPGRAARSRCC